MKKTTSAPSKSSSRPSAKYMYKVIVVGDGTCGKTSFIQRYVNNYFSNTYKATVGVDFAYKEYQLDDNTSINLQFWDIAGQERFGSMTSVFYREAVVGIIMYDRTNPQTFNNVEFWKQDIDKKVFLPPLDQNDTDDVPIPCVLIANKSDLPVHDKLNFTPEQMDSYCKQHGFVGWVETSAFKNINLDKAVSLVVEQVIKIHEKYNNIGNESSQPSQTINIEKLVSNQSQQEEKKNENGNSKKANSGSGCCGGSSSSKTN
ncbi:hypothetical protein ABK040_014341 [Willaertia magna]